MPLDPATATAILLYTLILVLPGGAVLAVAGRRPADGAVALGLAVGLGLATQPLVYLWAHVVGRRLGPAAWWLILVICGGIIAGRWWRGRGRTTAQVPASGSTRAAQVALAVVLLATLAARWWAARDVTVPLWGDSFQHSLMALLFQRSGGLPDSWRPFADLSTFTYHFGLHGGIATLAWLSGLPVYRALLVAGQMLMVLQVLTVYSLAAGLSGRPWAGVGAALAAAGLGPMPGYYLNWGRYTQLAGQVVLPVAALTTVWAASQLARDRAPRPAGTARSPRWPRWPPTDSAAPVLVAAWAVAGVALTHYLVTGFFALFAGAWVLVGPAVAGWAADRGAEGATSLAADFGRGRLWLARAGQRLVGLLPVAVVALALAIPWVPRIMAGELGGMVGHLATTRVANPDVFGIVAPSLVWASWPALDDHVGLLLVAVAVVGAAWGLARRQALVLLGVTWIALLLVAAYPGLVGLPVTGVLKDFTVAIGLYVPAGLVIGGAFGEVTASGWFARRSVVTATVIGVALVALAAAWHGRSVVEARYMLVTAADERAMAWIRDHTPRTAVFLVSSFDAYGGTVQAGDDGGWWLPVLADRRTTVPPITVGTERSFDPGYRERLNRLATACRLDLDGAACRSGLAAFGVTHAYVGPTGGALPRDRLASSRRWRSMYDADGVRVYERLAGAAGD